MALTRRSFLTQVGQAGGFGAAFLTMQGLGLAGATASEPVEVQAAPGSGNGVRVAVLGAGIAGLVAAYELRALGYTPVVLEARSRPGGRNLTVRGGDTVVLTDGSRQQCTWDKGNYQNFGPARLPSVHRNMLGYCQKLGVELQVEVNMSRSAHLQNDDANGGRFAVMRQVENDARGHVSELLSKSVRGGTLDGELSAEDRDRMLSFLRVYGPLDDAGKYIGSDRAGYQRLAGAGDQTGILSDPIDLHTLLDENFWSGVLFAEQFDMQATMFQPVGGMDRIPYAFAKSLGGIVHYNAPVTEVRKHDRGVTVRYTEHGTPKTLEAELCICALPLTLLRQIPNNLSAPYKKVIDECTYAAAYKIAWESRRFWEQDDNIYGGLEFVNKGCSPIWLPSAGLFSPRGVLVSGYTDEGTSPFSKLSIDEKFAESRKSVERLHPGRGQELEKPIYLCWGKMEWNEGSWIQTYGPGQSRGPSQMNGPASPASSPASTGPAPHAAAPGVALSRETGGGRNPAAARTGTNPGYETLIQPDDRVIFAGDHVSHIVAWQEGAAVSALRAVQQVSDRVKAARLGAGITNQNG